MKYLKKLGLAALVAGSLFASNPLFGQGKVITGSGGRIKIGGTGSRTTTLVDPNNPTGTNLNNTSNHKRRVYDTPRNINHGRFEVDYSANFCVTPQCQRQARREARKREREERAEERERIREEREQRARERREERTAQAYDRMFRSHPKIWSEHVMRYEEENTFFYAGPAWEVFDYSDKLDQNQRIEYRDNLKLRNKKTGKTFRLDEFLKRGHFNLLRGEFVVSEDKKRIMLKKGWHVPGKPPVEEATWTDITPGMTLQYYVKRERYPVAKILEMGYFRMVASSDDETQVLLDPYGRIYDSTVPSIFTKIDGEYGQVEEIDGGQRFITNDDREILKINDQLIFADSVYDLLEEGKFGAFYVSQKGEVIQVSARTETRKYHCIWHGSFTFEPDPQTEMIVKSYDLHSFATKLDRLQQEKWPFNLASSTKEAESLISKATGMGCETVEEKPNLTYLLRR